MIDKHSLRDRGCLVISLGVAAIGLSPLLGHDWQSGALIGGLAVAYGFSLFWRSA